MANVTVSKSGSSLNWSSGGGKIGVPNPNKSSSKKTSTKQSTDKFGSLINKIGSTLAPMSAYDTVNPFKNTSSIYDALAGEVERSIMRPQYERFSYNPFQRQWANQAAGSNLGMMGNKQRQYGDTLRRDIEMPYEAERDQMRTLFQGLASGKYQQEIADYYNSPEAFTNFSPFKIRQ